MSDADGAGRGRPELRLMREGASARTSWIVFALVWAIGWSAGGGFAFADVLPQVFTPTEQVTATVVDVETERRRAQGRRSFGVREVRVVTVEYVSDGLVRRGELDDDALHLGDTVLVRIDPATGDIHLVNWPGVIVGSGIGLVMIGLAGIGAWSVLRNLRRRGRERGFRPEADAVVLHLVPLSIDSSTAVPTAGGGEGAAPATFSAPRLVVIARVSRVPGAGRADGGTAEPPDGSIVTVTAEPGGVPMLGARPTSLQARVLGRERARWHVAVGLPDASVWWPAFMVSGLSETGA